MLSFGTTADVRRRRMPVVGKGTGVFSFMHVDDEPAALSEWMPMFAEALR
jgi:hypothetical protein